MVQYELNKSIVYKIKTIELYENYNYFRFFFSICDLCTENHEE